jgi:hypothetical protein
MLMNRDALPDRQSANAPRKSPDWRAAILATIGVSDSSGSGYKKITP